jgi:hypothetical protein
MHDDFEKKYGSNWLSKVKLHNQGGQEGSQDEDVYYAVDIDKDRYTIGVQVQIGVEASLVNRLSRNRELYPDNGKHHFGISGVVQYPPHPKDEITPGPEPIPDERDMLPDARPQGAGPGAAGAGGIGGIDLDNEVPVPQP